MKTTISPTRHIKIESANSVYALKKAISYRITSHVRKIVNELGYIVHIINLGSYRHMWVDEDLILHEVEHSNKSTPMVELVNSELDIIITDSGMLEISKAIKACT